MTGGGRRTGPAGAAMPRIACLLAPLRLLALVGLLGPGCGPADGAASPGLTPEEERQVLVHTVAVPLERIPVFVRDGGLIPLAQEDGDGLDIRRYGTASYASFRYYMDDGESHAYEHGEYAWATLEATGDGTDSTTTIVAPPRAQTHDLDGAVWHTMTPGA